VTTVIRWSSRPVGVVRVVAECAKRYISHEYIYFCHYDEQHSKYYKISSEEVLSNIDHIYSKIEIEHKSNEEEHKSKEEEKYLKIEKFFLDL